MNLTCCKDAPRVAYLQSMKLYFASPT